MEELDIKDRINAYKKEVINLTKIFIQKYFDEDWNDEEVKETYIAREVGTLIEINDFIFEFNDIVYCLEHNVSTEDLFDWYDYNQKWSFIGEDEHYINLNSWVKKCPRRSDEMYNRLLDLKNKVFEAQKIFDEEIKKIY